MSSFIFEFRESMMIALRAIRGNKMRSILTMLGIIIGIWAVVVMTTAIRGIDNSFKNGISALGTDVLYLDKWSWFTNEDWWKIKNRRNITMEQYDKFKDMVKLPIATAPVTNSRQTIKYGDRSVESVFLNGSTADYLKTTNFTFDMGRFYSEIESKGSRYVVVIGSEISKNLFPRGDGLDKIIKIGGVDYKIVGVLTEQGSFILGPFNPDQQVFVPIGTIFQNFQGHSNGTITFNIRAASPAMIEDTKAEAEGVMRQIRGLQYNQDNDFSINQQEGLMQNYNSVVGVIQIAGLFITGLSLFVGAIGIMNIMFVSVKERTKEIGLRKAIGAKKRTILGQFILESSTLCLMGGIIGMLLAILTSMLIKQYIATSISYSAVIIAITISLITGVAAGFAPAYTAAKMDPVDALRYE